MNKQSATLIDALPTEPGVVTGEPYINQYTAYPSIPYFEPSHVLRVVAPVYQPVQTVGLIPALTTFIGHIFAPVPMKSKQVLTAENTYQLHTYDVGAAPLSGVYTGVKDDFCS